MNGKRTRIGLITKKNPRIDIIGEDRSNVLTYSMSLSSHSRSHHDKGVNEIVLRNKQNFENVNEFGRGQRAAHSNSLSCSVPGRR
ncbi:hypothetical protein H5410_033653 [Solanum commersonii]|uniref:Uncharacterized protein n=1 Tax=Solanum commersonii TaxID=4109 RepID=A0A9J5YNG3_SOLCO|nr:hypothetical protein H5410_033653 [Solanum commersonii]